MNPNPSDEARYIQALGDSARAYPWRCSLPGGRHEALPRSDTETCRGCSIWAAAFLPLPLGGEGWGEGVLWQLFHPVCRSDVVWRKDASVESFRPDSRRGTRDAAPNAPAISAQSDEMDTACGCSP